jgi:hypothetical protein
MNSQRVKRTIKKTKSISNQNTWYQIKHLIKTRKLEKIQTKQKFYERFSDISKIFEQKASELNSVVTEKIFVIKLPKNVVPGQFFKFYIDGYFQNIKCPENVTSGGHVRLKIKKTRNISQELKELIKLRRDYKIMYKNGSYYGYPKCCINDFVIRIHNEGYREPIQELAGRYTGFTPCVKCSEKIVSKNLSPGDILKNRKCNHTFPLDDNPGHAFPCKKHAMFIFLKKITMDQAIASGCKDCYVSPKDDEEYEEDYDDDDYDNMILPEHTICSRCKH